MFTIDSANNVTAHEPGAFTEVSPQLAQFGDSKDLAAVLLNSPGERAVAIWNSLPGVVPITTKKFRNKETAVERIWQKLCDLFPEAAGVAKPERATTEDVPKKQTAKPKPDKQPRVRKARKATPAQKRTGRWAEELQAKLTEEFRAGQEFTIADVYKFVPHFKRLHRENNHVEARLRTTLAQEMVRAGVVKWIGKGKYQRLSTR